MKTRNAPKKKEFLELSTKEKTLLIFNKHGDNIPIDQLIEELYLFHKIERGLKGGQADRILDHEDVFKELLSDDEED